MKNTKSDDIFFEKVTVKTFVKNIKSDFYSGRRQEQIEVRECLLSFGAEPFVFQVAI
jgi:hypothetical protein